MNDQILVGFDRQEVAPEEPIPLTGYSNEPQRFHQTVGQPICVSCVAVSDSEGSTVLLVGLDCCSILDPLAGTVRPWVAKELGIGEERIFFSATHSHAAPALHFGDRYPEMARYTEKFSRKILEACRTALADRKPAKLRVGTIETHQMNFIKHYKAAEKGTGKICYIGDQFGDPNKVILLEHASQVDPNMHVVQFCREGGKDVVIANFRAHPHFDGGYTKYILSADYPGAFRTALESLCDCHAVYFQGACGNVNSSTRFPAERRFTSAESYGLGLAAYAQECLKKRMREVPGGAVKVQRTTVCGRINRTMEHLLPQAQEICKLWLEHFDREECVRAGEPYGIRSPYHARAINANAQRTDEKDGAFAVNALCIGPELALLTFPGEMFDAISLRAENASPFPTTLLLGYCNQSVGYLPTSLAFKYTSYETDISRFAPGVDEQVHQAYQGLLQALKKE